MGQVIGIWSLLEDTSRTETTQHVDELN